MSRTKEPPPSESASVFRRAWWEFQNQPEATGLGTAALTAILQVLLPKTCIVSWGILCPVIGPDWIGLVRWMAALVIAVGVTIVVMTFRSGIHQRDELRNELEKLTLQAPRELWVDLQFTGRVAHEPNEIFSVLNVINRGETASFEITAEWERLTYVPWIIPWSQGECVRTIIGQDDVDLIIGRLTRQPAKPWRLDPFRCGNTTGNPKELGTEAHTVLACHVDMKTNDGGFGRLSFGIAFYDDGTPIIAD